MGQLWMARLAYEAIEISYVGPTSFLFGHKWSLSCVSLIKLIKEPPRIDYKIEPCSNICLEVAKKPFQSQNIKIRVGQIVK